MSSQRNEDKYILDYFKESKGTFIDIGAFHPETFSNVRCLFDKGWTGILIEPSPSVYPALEKFYKNTDCELYNIAIANHTGELQLWDAKGDALSSTDKIHVEKWKSAGSKFTEITVPCLTVNDLISKSKFKTFDFINIDVENDQLGFDILRQFDLTHTKMVCLECAGEMRSVVQIYLKDFHLIYGSPENILLAR